MRRTRIAAAGVAVVAATAAVAALTASIADDGQQPSQDNTIVAHGDDRYPSTTATDWVTYADHVVAVTAVSEQTTPPTAEELARGEGVIGRQVTLRIDDTLWSSPNAPRPAPKTWEYSAMGWQFTDGDTTNRDKLAMHDRPRVEVGHQYVMAITWENAQCLADGESIPAQWMGLGEGSEIPFDNEVLGQGEMEGQIQSADETLAADVHAGEATGLEDQLTGQEATSLTTALNAATPVKDPALSQAPASPCQ